MPAVLIAVLAVLVAIHLLRVALSDDADAMLLARLAFVPGRLSFAWEPGRVAAAASALAQNDPDGAEVARFFLGSGTPQPWTVLTYALLHGSWAHVGLNGVWLLAFGAPVARRFGPWRFLVFLAGGAVAGAAVHEAIFPLDLHPLVGASAAVSACMGAGVRFIFQPVPDTRGPPAAEDAGVSQPPSARLGALLRDRRAMAFVLAWFGTNLVTGLGVVAPQLAAAPTAWQAHIGGSRFGLLALPLFDRVPAAGIPAAGTPAAGAPAADVPPPAP